MKLPSPPRKSLVSGVTGGQSHKDLRLDYLRQEWLTCSVSGASFTTSVSYSMLLHKHVLMSAMVWCYFTFVRQFFRESDSDTNVTQVVCEAAY